MGGGGTLKIGTFYIIDHKMTIGWFSLTISFTGPVYI